MAEDTGGEGRYPQRSDSLTPKRKEKYIHTYIYIYIYIYKENLIKQGKTKEHLNYSGFGHSEMNCENIKGN